MAVELKLAGLTLLPGELGTLKLERKNVELLYLCDVTESQRMKAATEMSTRLNYQPQLENDIRKVLEDKQSLVPILEDTKATIKEFAISKWMKGVILVGDSYSYTEWHDKKKDEIGRMLYDHKNDSKENKNIAELPENASLVKELSTKLNQNLPADYWLTGEGEYNK